MPSRGRKPAASPISWRDSLAGIDHSGALQDDEAARRHDPHGHSVAATADQDEPKGAAQFRPARH